MDELESQIEAILRSRNGLRLPDELTYFQAAPDRSMQQYKDFKDTLHKAKRYLTAEYKEELVRALVPDLSPEAKLKLARALEAEVMAEAIFRPGGWFE